MILIIYILTPFTMTHSIHLFQGFRIIQTRMMLLAILHGLRPNPKLKSILEGCTDLQHLWGTTLHSHNLFSSQFFQPRSVYIRFTHIQNLQPKFYVGSAMHHTLDREYSRSRKYLQLTNERLVQAELALRYWQEHDNLYIWAPIPIYTDRVDYRSLEMALIQEWQPRLNYPFICQFFHPKKGLLKKNLLNTNAQFGLATLWRRAKHTFTPQLVRQVLNSSRFQNRLELWTIIHALGSNTKARFEQTKMLRSNDGGLILCYALRRLANNTQEPFRTLSLNAIDASIKWWRGKPAPKATALRAPWCLAPDLQTTLKKFLRQWHVKMLTHQVPCHTPSFKTVFIKHAAILDILCNHKQAIDNWSTTSPAVCCCKSWSLYKSAALNPSDPHWVLSGSLLQSLLPPDLAVIAEGSLSNKVFPSKKEFHNQMRLGLKTWTKRNGLPSMSHLDINDLCHQLWSQHTHNKSLITSQSSPSENSKTPSKVQSSTVRTNMPPPCASFVRVFTMNPLKRHSKTRPFLNNYPMNHPQLSPPWSTPSNVNMDVHTLGQWAQVDNSHQDISWPNARKTSLVVDLSSPLLTLRFGQCSTSLPDSFFSLSQLLVPIILPLEMYIRCSRS